MKCKICGSHTFYKCHRVPKEIKNLKNKLNKKNVQIEVLKINLKSKIKQLDRGDIALELAQRFISEKSLFTEYNKSLIYYNRKEI